MKSVSQFIERKLKLVVNQEKSQVAKSEGVKFLGLTIVRGHIAISLKSMARAMKRVKELTPRGAHQKLAKTMEDINRWYRGWSSYCSVTQFPAQFVELEAHIRRGLRSRIIDQQKSRRNLLKKLMARAVEWLRILSLQIINGGHFHIAEQWRALTRINILLVN